jgi:thioredoxin reductase
MSSTPATVIDVIIIGGGPSGLAAALCLSRARYRTAIYDSGLYRNADAAHMHMVPTWDHRDPKEYRAEARKELVTRYGEIVELVDRAVNSVTKDDAGNFYAIDAAGKAWVGRKLVLATGVKDVLPDIPGYADCWGKGM